MRIASCPEIMDKQEAEPIVTKAKSSLVRPSGLLSATQRDISGSPTHQIGRSNPTDTGEEATL